MVLSNGKALTGLTDHTTWAELPGWASWTGCFKIRHDAERSLEKMSDIS